MTEKDKTPSGSKMNRRDVIKGLATIPVLGAMAYGTWRKTRKDHLRSHKLAKELNMSTGELEYVPYKHDGDAIRISIAQDISKRVEEPHVRFDWPRIMSYHF